MSVRVYLPATLASLAAHDAAGEIPASVDRVVAGGPDEESEYLALMSAADLSAELQDAAGRRVVLVAEVPDAEGPVPMSLVVAVHADTEAGAGPDDDLAWFASQEIPDLLASRNTEQ